jgi:precorrin-6B methylase 2
MIFEIFILLVLLYIILLLSYSLIFGAPYAGLGEKRINAMFELLKVKKGKSLIDIGSGDGRIVIKAAKMGLIATGVEINPILYLYSKFSIRIRKAKKTKILLKDMWQTDFSKYDYITIWGTKHMTKNLGNKLRKEVRPGTRIVSNHFQFENWKIEKMKSDVYLYIK